ncbi:YhgE/Pip domain-containing protein [Paenibacillus contaminans]|uniref:Phage infection protein n=1 Tax=Paenibacillus contaminans TaxID=450362 RepID=A0A329M6K7_9BACL|nr:ABC transporter permease [Paenibacillus contaminans]RAV15368.1 phage infection protein [Paenibacillus contaminans]
MFKNRLALLSPILAFLVIFIFSLTLFPSVQVQPKNLPIAIVNEDQGVEIPNQPKMNMGQTIVDTMQQTSSSTSGEDPAVKWVEVGSVEEVQNGLNNREYYAALVIPKDFSAKQASLRTQTPASPEVQIYINQGMNSAASAMGGQVLNGVVDNINNNVRAQILDGFNKQGATLTTEQASSLVTPIAKKVTNVNETGTKSANGNAPISLFQPLWMACIASAAILFIAISKTTAKTRKENVAAKLMQIAIGGIVAVVVGFGSTWLAKNMVGFHIPQFTDTALFLTITSFSFFLMISAVLSLFGMKGIAVFALMLFFGAPLLALAPEMMSSFYRDWVYSWLPMRFMVEGLRELFFFGKGLSWNLVSSLTWIGLASSIVILGSVLKPRAVRYQQKLEG